MTNQELIALVEKWGEFITLEDGYVHYCPRGNGTVAAWSLRVIADELDRRNAEWDAQVKETLAEKTKRVQ